MGFAVHVKICVHVSHRAKRWRGGSLYQAIFKNFISRSEISQYDIHKLAFGLGVIIKIRSLIKYFVETLEDCKNGHMLSIA